MYWCFPIITFSIFIGVWCETQYTIFKQQNWILPLLIIVCISFFIFNKLYKNIVLYNSFLYIKYITLGICLGITYSAIYNAFVQIPITMLDNQRADIYAIVTEYPEIYENNQRVSLKIDVKKSNLNMKIPYFYTLAYLPLTDEPIEPSDIVKTKLFFYIGSDDGGFDREEYYSGINYHILSECAYTPTFEVQKSDTIPLLLKPKILANNFKIVLENKLEDAGFMKGLLFGDTSDLSVYIKQDFQKAGLSHVLAVSGMHIGFIVLLFLTIFGKRFGMLISCIALIFFIPMTGASPSVIRAVIMYLISVGGFYLRRDNSLLHSLCFALVFLLIINPYSVRSISLQLSFLATLGIIFIYKPLQNLILIPFKKFNSSKLLKKLVYILTGALSCSISANIFTSPVLLLNFGYISIASTLANILTIGVFSVLFISGLLLCILGNIPIISSVLVTIINLLSKYVFYIADITGNISGFLLYWEDIKIKTLIISFYVFIILWVVFRKHFRYYIGIAISASIIAITIYVNTGIENNKYEVKLFNESGQTLAISSMRNNFAVIDCAGTETQIAAENVLAYMDWYNYKEIDLLIITSLDNGHAKSVPYLLENANVRRCILPNNYLESNIAQEILNSLKEHNVQVVYWTETGEKDIQPKSLGINIIGGTDRKLGVRIKKGDVDLLTFHSFTPKMLNELLSTQNINCKDVILSDAFLGDDKRIPEVLSTLQPNKIYIPTTFSEDNYLENIAYKTTKKNGDITFTTTIK